jgi:hypothetical protein
MITAIGILILVLGLIAWLGQSLALLVPSVAVRLGVLEREAEVDPTLYIMEAKTEAAVDILLTWTLPAAALLMLLEHPLWPYLGIFGSGVFLYFSGLITLSRVFLKRAGIRVGTRASERAAYLFGGLWALAALTMIGLAAGQLSG